MSTLTARNLIGDGLTDLGVVGIGRSLSARDGALGLRYLQELIDSAELDRPVIYTVARSSYTLTANDGEYTLGPSGNFVQARPLWIASALVKRVGEDIENPLEIWSRQRYLYEDDKTRTGDIPDAIYMEPTVTNATIFLLPIPTTACTLVIGTPTALTGFSSTIDTEYTFPPGYQEWFRLRLRNKLARPFGKALSEDMKEEERTAWRQLERVNDPGPPPMTNDYPTNHGGFLIESNRYR